MKKLLLSSVILPMYLATTACYNETFVDHHGKQTSRHSSMPVFYNEPNKVAATIFLTKYDLRQIEKYNNSEQSDIAVNLAYLGKYEESLAILRRLQKTNPSDYSITANLGTTFELVGKNDSALLYIKKGVKLNPGSHQGSEWVHIKILEAKLQLAKNPGWINNKRVLGTGVTLESPQNELLFEKTNDIEYQLQERVPFTPFPDKILANVFDELGDLYATQQSVEFAYTAYDFSLQYDPDDTYGAKKKRENLRPVLIKNKIPIPSWADNYLTRKGKKIGAAIENIIEKQLQNPENIDKVKDVALDIWDNISGEKTRREMERRRRNRVIFISGIAVCLLSLAGYLLYKRKNMAK